MTTRRFNRGLSNDFVNALNDEYGKRSWWRNLVDDRETFLAIRDDYVNVYYGGCSLLLLKLNGNRLEGTVDYKYLLRPDLQDVSRSIMVVDGKPDLGQQSRRFFLDDLSNLNDLKRAVEPYVGEEKTGVHDIILGNPNVLDVEIALSDAGTAPRIDLLAIHQVDEGFEIRFYEAKLFSNKRELRATGGGRPTVLRQIERYSRLLRYQHDDILNSYSKVCRNFSDLAGMNRRHPGRHRMLKRIADSPEQLRIDTKPRLLLFGFCKDQRDGPMWRRHRDKLHTELGKRLKMTGNARKLQLTN